MDAPASPRGIANPAAAAALLVAAPVVLAFSPALLDSFTPAKIAAFLIFSSGTLALCGLRLSRAVGAIPLSPVDLLLGLFLLLALLSVPLSVNPPMAARAALLLPPAAAFYAACRLAGRAGRRTVLDGFALLSIPVALYALAQAAGYDPWFAPPDFFSFSRAFSTLGNRNFVAYFLGAACLLALARATRSGMAGAGYAGTSALCAGTVAVLSTRGALLALAAGLLPLLLARAFAPRPRRLLPAAFAALILYLAFAASGHAPHLTERLRELPGDENVAMRLELWRAGLDAFAARPLLGAGFGCFPDAFADAKERLLAAGDLTGRFRIHATRAHNGFVQVAAELGVVGFGLLLALLTAAWRGSPAAPDRALFVYFLAGTLYDFPAETAAGGLLFLALLSGARSAPVIVLAPRPFERRALAAALLLLPLPLLAVAGSTLASAAALRGAETAFARGRHDEAERLLRRAAAAAVFSDRARFRLANRLLDRGDPAGALELYESLIERRRDPAVLHNTGIALLQLDRIDEAEARFLEALPRSAEPHGPLMNLGVVAERRDAPEAAAALYRRSLASRPTGAALLNLLGLARALPVEDEVLERARATGLLDDPATRAALAERFRSFGDLTRAAALESPDPAVPPDPAGSPHPDGPNDPAPAPR